MTDMMASPPPPPPPPSPDQWHGKCFLMSESGNDVCMVMLASAAPPTRIVLNHSSPPGPESQRNFQSMQDIEVDHTTPMDVWLLVGSPMREPLARHWSAIYVFEEILS